jgi:hypothetical protein
MRLFLVAVALLAAGCAKERGRARASERAPEPPAPRTLGEWKGREIVSHGDAGLLADGTKVLALDGGRWRPVVDAGVEGERIDLGDGDRWVAFDKTWRMPAHSPREVDRREVELRDEAEKLPRSLKAKVTPRLRLMATISATEGGFGDTAGPGDTSASLGIFQWAASRKRAGCAGTSLSRFLGDLRRRTATERHREQRVLYRAAWQEVNAAGVDLRDGKILLRRKPAHASEVEQVLQNPMNSGSLRTYQLVAALDWIDRIGNGKVKVGRRQTTVQKLLPSDHGMATAVLLGVNRPAWVVPSLTEAAKQAGTRDEGKLLYAFRHRALTRYTDAEHDRRVARLLTSESAY